MVQGTTLGTHRAIRCDGKRLEEVSKEEGELIEWLID